MILVCAKHLSPDVASELNGSGYTWKQVHFPAEASELTPAEGWEASILMDVEIDCASRQIELLRSMSNGPVVGVFETSAVSLPILKSVDAFVIGPSAENELAVRLTLAIEQHASINQHKDSISYGPVVLDTKSYQVRLGERSLDMTYMEYELLKHFVLNVNIVLTREDLLRDVWGYAYFGGGRTVDVHVRRLRAKFGQEHAHLISTIRSVGYLFGDREQQ